MWKFRAFLYKKRSLIVTIVTICLTGGLAAASSAPALAASAGYLCSGDGAGYCASLLPGATVASGDPVYSIAQSSSWRWEQIVFTGVCNNGHVSSSMSCPFTPGSGLNAEFDGDLIVQYYLFNNTNYCMANDSGNVLLRLCSNGAAQEWVLQDNDSGGTSGYVINVGQSNNAGVSRVLSNAGSGNQLADQAKGAQTYYHQDWAFTVPQ